MSKIPTAEEFLIENKVPPENYYYPFFTDLLVRFGRVCAKAALEEAAKKSLIEAKDLQEGNPVQITKYVSTGSYKVSVNKQSILDAYPDENIK